MFDIKMKYEHSAKVRMGIQYLYKVYNAPALFRSKKFIQKLFLKISELFSAVNFRNCSEPLKRFRTFQKFSSNSYIFPVKFSKFSEILQFILVNLNVIRSS